MPANKKDFSPGSKSSSDQVSLRKTTDLEKPLRRSFPGPRDARVTLRVTMERGAYAELIAHAKESLEAEVCGVLAGQICEDDAGLFVHVEAVIRGAAASHGSTHVTFTQATWNDIYQTLERHYPKLRMVGWYHTHPGFGVEFSEMDLFIQKNFFSGAGQIALVTDPLSGAVAICVNTPDGTEYLSKFWVDGREQIARVPEQKSSNKPAAAMEGALENGETFAALEAKVNQLLQTVDEQRRSYHRFLMTVGVIFCLGMVVGIGYFAFSLYANRNEPPKVNQVVPIPVQIGDKTVLIGVAVTEWQVPPELNSILLQMEKLKRDEEEKAIKEKEKRAAAATNQTSNSASKTKK